MVSKAPFAPLPSGRRRYPAGFTLVELLVVIAVVAVLAAIAVPSYTQMIANNRVRSTAQSFQAALMKARSEALKRNGNVLLLRDGDSWNCTQVGGHVEGGWIIRWDSPDLTDDEDPVIDRGCPAAGVSLSTGGVTSIRYASSGRPATAGATITVRIQDDGGKADARCVSTEPSGLSSVDDDC